MLKELFIVRNRITLHAAELHNTSFTGQKQPSAAIHFQKFHQEISVLQSFF